MDNEPLVQKRHSTTPLPLFKDTKYHSKDFQEQDYEYPMIIKKSIDWLDKNKNKY